jgi:hypothetical protein
MALFYPPFTVHFSLFFPHFFIFLSYLPLCYLFPLSTLADTCSPRGEGDLFAMTTKLLAGGKLAESCRKDLLLKSEIISISKHFVKIANLIWYVTIGFT